MRKIKNSCFIIFVDGLHGRERVQTPVCTGEEQGFLPLLKICEGTEVSTLIFELLALSRRYADRLHVPQYCNIEPSCSKHR